MKQLFFVVLVIGMISAQLVHGQSVTISTTPTPANICAGQSIALQANPMGGVDSTYLWVPGGYTTQSINVYPPDTTIYMVTVTFTGGATAVAYQMVNVLPSPTPVITSVPAVPEVCEGETVQLFSSPADTYQWYLNGAIIPGANAQSYICCVAGSYQVHVTVGTCSTLSASTVVTINPLPLPASSILGTSFVCQAATASFLAGSISHATEYIWSVPTGATITSGQGTQTIYVTFATAGSGYVSVRGHNDCGDGQPFLLPITINPTPIVDVVATNTNPCAGTGIDITANGNGTFVWSPSGKTTQTIHEVPSQSTTYSVVATLGTCTATGSVFINVHQLPDINLALTPTSACTDQNMITLTGGSPPYGSYLGTCVMGRDKVYPPIAFVGTYPIRYTYTDAWGCSDTSQVVNFTINAVPQLSFTNIPYPIYTDTDPINLNDYVDQTGCTFSGPGVVEGTTAFDPEMAGAGIHMITCYYTHPISGCSVSQIQYFPVAKALGIKEFLSAVDNIIISPNPAMDHINVSGISTKNIKNIRITNILGTLVYSTTAISDTMHVDLDAYASGTYIISFISADGISKSKRFMKNN